MGIRTWLVVVGISMFAAHARADAPPIEDAIKQAAAAHKPLVIEFGAQWCGPCKLFESKVLPDTKVQAALKDVVFVRYDVDVKVGGLAAAKYSISAYPTFLVVDAQGVEVSRKQGLLGPAEFVSLLANAHDAAMDEPAVRASLRGQPNDPAVLLGAAHWFESHKLRSDAIRIYDQLSTHKDASAEQRLDATGKLVTLRRHEVWTRQLLAEKLALIRAQPAAAKDDDLVIATVRSELPLVEVKALWQAVFDATGDVDRLNHLVYLALAADASEEALAAAKRIVDKRPMAQYFDTLAECYHVRGDKELALKNADQAIRMEYDVNLQRTLRQNRDRFANGGADVDDVRQLRLRAADLWKRMDAIDRLAQRVADPDRAVPQEIRDRQDRMMTQLRAEHELAVKVAKTCITDAVDNEEAIARVELDDKGAITSSVLLLEPSATPALRSCLTKQLAGAVVTADPFRRKTKLTINFGHTH